MMRRDISGVVRVAALAGIGLALIGCQNMREAAGMAKMPPDEFTVLTKAPLVIPPDYNLRPPQVGAAPLNQYDPEESARSALFPQDADSAAALGPTYSAGEKVLLTKSGALSTDPNIRGEVTSDAGYEDKGAAYANKVLYPQAKTATPAVPAAQPAPAAAPESPTPAVRGPTD